MSKQYPDDAFSVRGEERYTVLEERPEHGRFLAIRAVSVEMPEGPKKEFTNDGDRVESAAIIAADWSHKDQYWVWCPLAPNSKMFLGDLIFDNGLDKDRWYYVLIEDNFGE